MSGVPVVPHDSRGPSRWQDGLGRAATRSAQTLLVLALVVVVSYVLITLRLVVVPLLLALLIAAAVAPFIDWLSRHRVPRGLAVALALLLGFGVLGGVGFLVGDAVAGQFDQLREGALEGVDQLQEYVTKGPLGIAQADVDRALEQATAAAQGAQVRAGAVSGAALVAQVVTGAVLALVVLFYVLKDSRLMWGFLKAQFPVRAHARLDAVAGRSVSVLGGYVRGTAIVATVDAVLIGVGLLVVGVPPALPLALVTFIGAFVPLIGAVAAGLLAALIALVSNGPVAALIVVAIVIGVNQIEGNVLAPYVLGKNLSLHPLVVLLALTAGTIVAGIIGAVLAVPFAAVAWGAVSALREQQAHEQPPPSTPEVELPPPTLAEGVTTPEGATEDGAAPGSA